MSPSTAHVQQQQHNEEEPPPNEQEENEPKAAAAKEGSSCSKMSSLSLEESDDGSSLEEENTEGPNVIGSFIPVYLRQFVAPYYGDFCQTNIFHERLIAQLISEGFLPIASRNVLLPKLHKFRSVVHLAKDLHVSKSTRKRANKFYIKLNNDFDGVVRGCHEQHGRHCWLVPPLVRAFRAIHQATTEQGGRGVCVRVFDDQLKSPSPNRFVSVRLFTMEVYNKASNALVAGELGYTVGTIYTSLTGFSKQDGAGSVQLAALGKLLCLSNFHLWDLGMDMEYKQKLGAHLMPRRTYLRHVKKVREQNDCLIQTPANYQQDSWCARNVIDEKLNQPAQQQQQQLPHKKKKKHRDSQPNVDGNSEHRDGSKDKNTIAGKKKKPRLVKKAPVSTSNHHSSGTLRPI